MKMEDGTTQEKIFCYDKIDREFQFFLSDNQFEIGERRSYYEA